MNDPEADLEIPELTEEMFARSMRHSHRRRLMEGKFESGEDVAALRRFIGLTQEDFARALGISVHTLRRRIAAGELPAFRTGRRIIRIRVSDLEKLLRRVPTTYPR